jgi:preprotein translocase subunit SecA
MSVVDPKLRSDIEKEIYLKTLDNAWREHLYQMDSMKTGIRLRAYNQKDPLVEYKKESFNLFSELVETIKYDTIKTLHAIRFRVESVEEEAEALARQMELEKRQEEMRMALNQTKHEEEEKKISRNDDCPCGSGLKYKNCCGKSGPKKGVFAS